MKKVLRILALLLMMGTSALYAQKGVPGKITADLASQINATTSSTELVRVIIVMNEQYDATQNMRQTQYLDKTHKREFVVNELQRISVEGQRGLMNDLRLGEQFNFVSNIKPFWIINGVSCSMTKDMVYAVADRPDVKCIMPDYVVGIPEGEDETTVAVEPGRGENQWNVVKVNADDVWEMGYTGQNVVVAVIDSGVNYYHNDIAGNMWDGGADYPNHGWDFVNDDDDPFDDHSHGTHCAGTVSSYGSSGYQCGIAKDAKIMALKVLSYDGYGYTSYTWSAIQFAVSNGADVLSMSLGSDGVGGVEYYRTLMENVMESGLVASVAAGNTGNKYDDYGNFMYPVPYNVGSPGNVPSPWRNPDQILDGGRAAVVTVGATTSDDIRSDFSSYGPVTWTEGDQIGSYYDYPYVADDPVNIGLIKPDIAAPGSSIVSLRYDDDYGYSVKSGTSMATPCVAGVMALMLSANPELTPAEIDEILESTAVQLGGYTSKNNYYGAGRVDAVAAVASVVSGGEISFMPETLDLGYRPNGAWMRPESLQIFNNGGLTEVQALSVDNPYFQLDLGAVAVPFNVGYHQSVDVAVSTGTSTTVGTSISGQITVNYSNDSVAHAMVTAIPYNPTARDVWETAYAVTSFPYTDNLVSSSIPLYDNYNLPPTDTPDGPDAVYKLVFTQDALLNAAITNGDDGKMVLYNQDFKGEGGPMVENCYTGPMNDTYNESFEIQYGEGTATAGYFPFYTWYCNSVAENLFRADELQAAGMKKSKLTSLSWYATNQTGYPHKNISIWLANVSETELNTGSSHLTSDMTLVYTGTMTPQVGWNEFEFNENTFEWDGVSNLLICVQKNNFEYNGTIRWQTHETGFVSYAYSYSDGTVYDATTTIYGMNTTSARANVLFKGAGMSVGPTIDSLTVTAGTYYLVASSTSDSWSVEINTESLDCPEQVSHPTPSDYATNVLPTEMQLRWRLGDRTTAYKLLLGTDYDNLETIVDWTRDLAESYTLTGLSNNTDYFWQVMERNDGCPTGVEGPIWSFTTTLDGPGDFYAWNNYLYEGDELHLEWSAMNNPYILSYNIYQDSVLIGNTTEAEFIVDGLAYNMEGYVFWVTAVYAGGESNPSGSTWVYVSGSGSVSGFVYEQDGTTSIEDVNVIFSGYDEFGYYREYSFTSNATGYYNGNLYAGSYNAVAVRIGYQDKNYDGTVYIAYNNSTSHIDFVMDELFNPVSAVTAEYYPDAENPNSPYVNVQWETFTSFAFDFEDSSMQGWTEIDSDGDGYTWYLATQTNLGANRGHNGSYDCALSQSYINDLGALYPDNYFVSPLVPLGGSIGFWACAQDASYAAEHFGVAVSTTSNTDPSTFVMLDEWTMSAKSGGNQTLGDNGPRGGNGRSQGTWYYFTVDLSAYNGEGYVAIRHFNCTDMYYLLVDDILIQTPIQYAPPRSFQHYRVYRTDYYNNGPFTEENTVLLADNVTDSHYVDNTWTDAEIGVYKYGVSCVYAGNRESSIRWDGQSQVNHSSKQRVVRSEHDDFNGPAPYVIVPENASLPILRTESSEAIVARWHHGNDFANFFLNNPAEGYSLGFTNDVFTNGACYMNETIYFSDSEGKYGIIDPENGLEIIATDRPFTVIDDNPVDGKMYGCNPSGYLYEINPEDGSYTELAYMPVSTLVTFTITNDGRFIICDRGDETIKEYIPSTGELNTLITLDWNIEYGQDMATDRETNEVYWAAYNYTDYCMPLIKIDLENNTITTLGYFDGQVSAFAITDKHFIQTERESEIVWSNSIDKNMVLTDGDVNITVTLNSGDSPEGVLVHFTNLSAGEQQMHPMADVTLDATGYYAWDSFRRGDYRVTVSFADYETIEEEVGIWDATALNYVLSEINYGLRNLYVSRTGWASWTDSKNGNSVPFADSGGSFYVDFEDGLPMDWTTIDANNDGYNWVLGSQSGGVYLASGSTLSGTGHNSSADMICSGSYSNVTSAAITPDNYLVSPQVVITNGSTFSFYACAQDASYAAEHFGVAVSLGSNTNPSDFTMIQEWTMTAKDSGMKSVGRNGATRGQGTWYQYSVDLSSYAGQIGYIALRHFNCYDQFILDVDDIEYGIFRDNRHFNNYHLVLTDTEDNVIYQTTQTDCYLQLPVENLVDGETYRLKVAADYSSSLSDWKVVDWIYQSCDNFEGVTELNMEMNPDYNVLSWTYPVVENRSTDANYAFVCNNGGGSYPYGWIGFDVEDLSGSEALNPDLRLYGGDYCGLDGYVYSTYDNNWYKVDLWTGEVVEEGYLGYIFFDCAWDYTSETMFCVNSSTLYVWNIDDNSVEVIGSMGNAYECLACDLDGQLWGIAIGGSLYRIDKTNASEEYVGSTGLSCDWYWQTCGFDHYTGKLYWYGVGFFAEVDTQTGQGIVIDSNTGSSNHGTFCVPFNGNDYISPVTGVLGAMLYRDGELLGFTRGNSFVDYIAPGNHKYEVRVVYNGNKHCPNFNSYYAMSCPTSIGGESYEVAVTAVPEEGGTVTGSGTYINGFPCTVTATEADGFVFINWTVDGQEVAATPEYTFRVTDNVTVEANFMGFTPHWTVVDNPNYEPMSLIGVVQVNGEEQGANYLEVAALCGNECRGRQMMTYVSELDRYFVYMTIYGMDNDQITFGLYDHLLEEETEFACLTDLTFMTDETIGSTADPYVINFGVVQETAMQMGWNWYASAVEADDVEALEMLETSLGANGVMIKSQTDGFVMNYDNYWVGNLYALSNDQMYMVKTDAQVNAIMGGFQPDVTAHSITIYPGWTWLGYPNYEAMDINDALAGFEAKDGDLLKAKQSFSSYVEGQGWIGSLLTLNPGVGMMYYSTRSVSVPLTYSGQGSRQVLAPNITAENNHWVPNAFEYPDNMSIMAVVELDGVEVVEDNYELAVFDGSKCVGSAKLVYIEPLNRYVSFLTVTGEEGSELQFGLFNDVSGLELFNASNVVVFEPNAIIGSLDEPYIINFKGTAGINQYQVDLNIYPNPVGRGTQFRIGIVSGKIGLVKVEIVDALGATVYSAQSSRMPVTATAPATAGVYMIKVCVDGTETYCRKLIVK